VAYPTTRLGRRVALALVLLTLATVLRGIVWSGLLPPWQGPDEPSHYAFVERLANFSYPNRDDPRDRASPALDASIRHTAFAYFLVHDQRRPFSSALRSALPPEPPNLSQSAPASLTTDGYPPLYYALLAPLVRLPGLHTATSRLYAARFGSALLGGLLVVLTFFLIREVVADDVLALSGAGVLSLAPVVSQASAIVNADIGLAVACTALAVLALRTVRLGVTARRLLAAGACALAATLMKPFGIVAAAVLVGALLVLPLVLRRTGRPVLVASAVAIAGAFALFVLGLARYRLLDVSNLRFAASYLWQFYLPRAPGLTDVFPAQDPLTNPVPAWSIWGETGIGSFGWLSAQLRLQIVELGAASIAAAVVVAIVGVVIRRRRLTERQVVVLCSCAVGVLLYVLGLHAAEVVNMIQARGTTQPVEGRILQGRYLIPIAPLALALVLAGAHAWSRRVALATSAAWLVIWFGISVAALNTVIRFYAT
jgi:4-amino-4-deoxy-L-arabinose transferase-like glycosyltransferase